jgi:hypothetical protein
MNPRERPFEVAAEKVNELIIVDVHGPELSQNG